MFGNVLLINEEDTKQSVMSSQLNLIEVINPADIALIQNRLWAIKGNLIKQKIEKETLEIILQYVKNNPSLLEDEIKGFGNASFRYSENNVSQEEKASKEEEKNKNNNFKDQITGSLNNVEIIYPWDIAMIQHNLWVIKDDRILQRLDKDTLRVILKYVEDNKSLLEENTNGIESFGPVKFKYPNTENDENSIEEESKISMGKKSKRKNN